MRRSRRSRNADVVLASLLTILMSCGQAQQTAGIRAGDEPRTPVRTEIAKEVSMDQPAQARDVLGTLHGRGIPRPVHHSGKAGATESGDRGD